MVGLDGRYLDGLHAALRAQSSESPERRRIATGRIRRVQIKIPILRRNYDMQRSKIEIPQRTRQHQPRKRVG